MLSIALFAALANQLALAAGRPAVSASELLEINSMKAVVNGEVITSAEVEAANKRIMAKNGIFKSHYLGEPETSASR